MTILDLIQWIVGLPAWVLIPYFALMIFVSFVSAYLLRP